MDFYNAKIKQETGGFEMNSKKLRLRDQALAKFVDASLCCISTLLDYTKRERRPVLLRYLIDTSTYINHGLLYATFLRV